MATVAAEYGLTLHEDTAVLDRLHHILGRFADLTGRLGRIGPVLMREGKASTLWLFEFQRIELGLSTRYGYRPNLEVTMLGILIEYHESEPPLPDWRQGAGSPPQPPHTPASLARLATIDDLRMGMAERFVLFASEPAAWALKQAVDQSISAEFHPGLLNSSLPIDVQRAIDVVALMRTDRAAPERFYRPAGIEVRLPVPGPVGIQPRLDKAREQMEADRAVLRERMAREREERAARMAAEREQREAERDARKAEREARHAKARAEREAERERHRADLQGRMNGITERARTSDGPAQDQAVPKP